MGKHVEDGKSAARAYYKSQGFASLTRSIRPEHAIMIFVNIPTNQTDQKAWKKGFASEQIEILAEMEIEKVTSPE